MKLAITTVLLIIFSLSVFSQDKAQLDEDQKKIKDAIVKIKVLERTFFQDPSKPERCDDIFNIEEEFKDFTQGYFPVIYGVKSDGSGEVLQEYYAYSTAKMVSFKFTNGLKNKREKVVEFHFSITYMMSERMLEIKQTPTSIFFLKKFEYSEPGNGVLITHEINDYSWAFVAQNGKFINEYHYQDYEKDKYDFLSMYEMHQYALEFINKKQPYTNMVGQIQDLTDNLNKILSKEIELEMYYRFKALREEQTNNKKD
jgi:hypothetical protein